MLEVTSRRRLTLYLTLAFLVLVDWHVYLLISPDKDTTWNYLFNVGAGAFYFVAAIVAFRRWSKSSNNKVRAVARNFGAAAFLWGMGYIVWAFYNLVLEQTVPYPSLADVFFLTAYILLAMAMWDLHNLHRFKSSRRAVVDSVIIVLVSAAAIFAFLNRPDVSPDLGLAKNLLNVGYSLGDVILVAGALIIVRAGRIWQHKALLTVILFLLFQAAADFLFAYRNNAEQYWNGDTADLLFGVSGFLFAVAMTHNSLLTPRKKLP